MPELNNADRLVERRAQKLASRDTTPPSIQKLDQYLNVWISLHVSIITKCRQLSP